MRKQLCRILSAGLASILAAVLGGLSSQAPVAVAEEEKKLTPLEQFLLDNKINDPNPNCWYLKREMKSSQVGGKNRYDTANVWRGQFGGGSPLFMVDMPTNYSLSNTGWDNAIDALAGAVSNRGYVFQMNPAADYMKLSSLEGPFGKDGSRVKWDSGTTMYDYTTGFQNLNTVTGAPAMTGAEAAFNTLKNSTYDIQMFDKSLASVDELSDAKSLVVVQNGLGKASLSGIVWALINAGVPMTETQMDSYISTHMSKGVNKKIIWVGSDSAGKSFAYRHGIDTTDKKKWESQAASSDLTDYSYNALRSIYVDTKYKTSSTTNIDLLYVIRGNNPEAMLSDTLSAVQYYYRAGGDYGFSAGSRAGILFWDDSTSNNIESLVGQLNPIKIFLSGGKMALHEGVLATFNKAIETAHGEAWRDEASYSCKPKIVKFNKSFVDKPRADAVNGWVKAGDTALFEIYFTVNNIWTTDEGSKYGGVPQRMIRDTIPEGLKFKRAWLADSGSCSYNPDDNGGYNKANRKFDDPSSMDIGAYGTPPYGSYKENPKVTLRGDDGEAYGRVCVEVETTQDTPAGTEYTNKACMGDPDSLVFMQEKCAEAKMRVDQPQLRITKTPLMKAGEVLRQGAELTYDIEVENVSRVNARKVRVFENAKEGLILRRVSSGNYDKLKPVPGGAPKKYQVFVGDMEPGAWSRDSNSFKNACPDGTYLYSANKDSNTGCTFQKPEGYEYCGEEPWTCRTCDYWYRTCYKPEKLSDSNYKYPVRIISEITKVDKTNMFADVVNIASVSNDWYNQDMKHAPDDCTDGDERCAKSVIRQGNANLKIEKKLADQYLDKTEEGELVPNVHAGQDASWVVTVTNTGNVPAVNAHVFDIGGDGVDMESLKKSAVKTEYDPKDGPFLGSSRGSGTQNHYELDPGQSTTVTVTAKLTADKVNNIACVEAENVPRVCSDSGGEDNSKLEASKTVAGSTSKGLDFEITVENTGKGRGRDVVLVDEMRANPQPVTRSETETEVGAGSGGEEKKNDPSLWPGDWSVTDYSGAFSSVSEQPRQAKLSGLGAQSKAGVRVRVLKDAKNSFRGKAVNKVYPLDDPACGEEKNKGLCREVAESSVNVSEEFLGHSKDAKTGATYGWFKVAVKPTTPGVGVHGVNVTATGVDGSSGEEFLAWGVDGFNSAPDFVRKEFTPPVLEEELKNWSTTRQGYVSGGKWTVGDIPADTEYTALLRSKLTDVGKGFITNVVAGTALFPGVDYVQGCEDNPDLDSDVDGCDKVDSKTSDPLAVKVTKVYTGSEGDKHKFLLTVRNTGAAVTRPLNLKDLVPFGMGFEAGPASQGEFEGSVWKLGQLQPGVSATVEVAATGKFPAGKVNRVFPTDDPDCGKFKNECAQAGTVKPGVLRVSKVLSGVGVVKPGEVLKWSVTGRAVGGSWSGVVTDVPLAGLEDVKIVYGEKPVVGLSFDPGVIPDGGGFEATVTGKVKEGVSRVVNAVSVSDSPVSLDADGLVRGCLDEDGVDGDTDGCDFSAVDVVGSKPEPGPGPSVEPEPEPSVEPEPGPSVEPSGKPSVEPEPEPSAEPEPEPSVKPSGPSVEPTPKPSTEPASKITIKKTIDTSKKNTIYRIDVTNNTSKPTKNLTIEDTMLLGDNPWTGKWEFTSQTSGTLSNEKTSWTIPTLETKKTVSAWVRIADTPKTGGYGIVTNTARIKNTNCNRTPDGCAQVSLLPPQVNKRIVPASDDKIHWLVEVRNPNNTVLPNVRVQETPGVGVSSLEIKPSGDKPNKVEGLTWLVGDMQPGETKKAEITAVAPESEKTISEIRAYSAVISSPAASCQVNDEVTDDDDSCDQETTDPTRRAEKKQARIVLDKQAIPGDTPAWYVRVRNAGNAPSSSPVWIRDQIQGKTILPRFLNDSISRSCGSVEAGVWKINQLDAGQECVATVVADETRELTNQAWAAGVPDAYTPPENCQPNDSLDGDTDGCDAALWTPPGVARGGVKLDVAVRHTDGQQVDWQVSVKNTSGADIPGGVSVIAQPDPGVTQGGFVSASSGIGLGDSWVTGGLKNGQTVTAAYRGVVSRVGVLRAFVSGYSEGVPCEANGALDADTDACDYQKQAVGTRQSGERLTVKKTRLESGFPGVLLWQIAVKNEGDTRAEGVKVTDSPDGKAVKDLVLVEKSTGGFRGGVWDVGMLEPGGEAVLKLRSKWDNRAGFNMAWAGSKKTPEKPGSCVGNETGFEDTDRCDRVEVPAGAQPGEGQVRVFKEIDRVDVEAKTAFWRVRVENTGKGVLENVKVTDVGVEGVESPVFAASRRDSLVVSRLGVGESRVFPVESRLVEGVSRVVNTARVGVARGGCVESSGLCARAVADVSWDEKKTLEPGETRLVEPPRPVVEAEPPRGDSGVPPVGSGGASGPVGLPPVGGSGGALAVTGSVAGVALLAALMLSGGGGWLLLRVRRRGEDGGC